MFTTWFVENLSSIKQQIIMVTLNFKILPNRRKASNKLGIYLAVSHKKETRYITTEFEIDDTFQFEKGKVCYRKDSEIMNKRMDYVLKEYNERLLSLDISNYPDCASLKEALIRWDSPNAITLKDLFSRRIIRLQNEGRDSYARMHNDTLKVLLKELGNLPASTINKEDICTFCRNMENHGYSQSGIQIKLSQLKAVLNEAVDNNLIKLELHPFRNFKIPRPEIRLMDVDIDDFQKIRNHKTESKRCAFARDMFLLSFYLGGINLVDLVKVDLSGKLLNYTRQKTRNKKTTEKQTTFQIPEIVQPLIKKHAPHGKLLLPCNSKHDQLLAYTNRCFQLLKQELGITTRFSYYSARKTFAQFAFMLGIKTEVIEYCIGQTMKTNRPIYNYVRVMQRQADMCIRKVIDYTENPDAFDLYDGF